MGAKKESFAKLTEDLENLQKSDEPKVNIEEPVVPVEEPEVVEPAAEPVVEEPKVEEPKAEEPAAEEPKAEEPKAEDESVAKSAEEPVAEEPEELEKAKKEDKPEDKEDDKEPKKDDKKKKEDKKEDKEPVKKSESSEDEVTEADFLGAFEAVTKSYSGIRQELAEVKAQLADVLSMLKPAEPLNITVDGIITKSAEPVAEEPVAEPEEEPVSKSVEEPEEDSEGKAVEYVSKSNGVPELPAEDEPQAEPEEEPEAEFNPKDHVKQVTEYYMKNTSVLSQGQKSALRGAVNRVKRNEGTEVDIALFKEVSEIYKN